MHVPEDLGTTAHLIPPTYDFDMFFEGGLLLGRNDEMIYLYNFIFSSMH